MDVWIINDISQRLNVDRRLVCDAIAALELGLRPMQVSLELMSNVKFWLEYHGVSLEVG